MKDIEHRIVQEGSVLVDEAPEKIVFDDVDWLPMSFEQAERRMRRNGARLLRRVNVDNIRFKFGFADGSEATMEGFSL